jgi:3-methyladenine DNA glycosylase AlkD
MVELERKMLKKFLAELEHYSDQAVAEGQKNYHKVERPYLGVRVPQITEAAVKTSAKLTGEQLLTLCDELWETNICEARIAVGKILERKTIIDMDAIWIRIDRFKEDLDSWAIADHLAHAAFRCLKEKPLFLDDIERSWLNHPSLWVRRASLVFTLFLAKKGQDPERPLSWASGMVDDREWFIQKAIGWWLRELSKHNPQRVLTFLEDYRTRMKPFAVREASKYLKRG